MTHTLRESDLHRKRDQITIKDEREVPHDFTRRVLRKYCRGQIYFQEETTQRYCSVCMEVVNGKSTQCWYGKRVLEDHKTLRRDKEFSNDLSTSFLILT